MNDYYVYALCDPRYRSKNYLNFGLDYLPKYIGKGRGNRVNVSAYLEMNYLRGPKSRWLKHLAQKSQAPVVTLVKTSLSETKAFKLERLLIKSIGRKDLTLGPLLNRSFGGEGGNRLSLAEKQAYLKSLKNTNLSLLDDLINFNTYVTHNCDKHGEVRTVPAHVLKRLSKNRPPCPKCGIENRGKIIRKQNISSGLSSYKKLLAEYVSIEQYQLTGKYKAAVELTEHTCYKHGSFLITPANVRSKLFQGLTPCPSCNLEQKEKLDPWINKRSQKMQDYIKRISIGSYRLLDQNPTLFVSSNWLKHRCKHHGIFQNKVAYVLNNLLNGRSPCQECNLEVRNAKNAVNSRLGALARKSRFSS